MNPKKLRWPPTGAVSSSLTRPIWAVTGLTVFVVPFLDVPPLYYLVLPAIGLAVTLVPALLRRRAEASRGGVSKQDVVEGIERWASASGFASVKAPSASTLPARGYPFGRFDTQRIDAMATKRVGSHDLLVMLLWLGFAEDHDPDAGFYYTVVAAHVAADFPTTVVSPRGMGRRVRRALGPGLEVESNEFNRKWSVFTSSLQDAHAILSPTVIQMLLARDPGDTLPVQWDGNAVFTTSAGYTAVPDRLEARVELVTALAEESLALRGASGPGASPDAFLAPATDQKVPLDLAETLAGAFMVLALIGVIPLAAIMGDSGSASILLIPVGISALLFAYFYVHRMAHVRRSRREWVDRYRAGKA